MKAFMMKFVTVLMGKSTENYTRTNRKAIKDKQQMEIKKWSYFSWTDQHPGYDSDQMDL